MFSKPRALLPRSAQALACAAMAIASAQPGTHPRPAPAITTPVQQFGASLGDDYFLATYTELEAYWRQLDRESDRMALVDIGRTEEGRTQWMAIITAPENFRTLDRYKDISRRLAYAEGLTDAEARALAQEGKAVVWIDGGLHADEVLGAQQLIETVYQLVSRNDAETRRVLRDVIVLAVHANPDGHELVAGWYMREKNPGKRTLAGVPRLYQKYAGHDNNRDFYMATQAETINMNRILYREWLPQIVYNHHQADLDGAVMFAPPFRDSFNYVFDPLIPASIDQVGAAMHDRFAAEGKRGVTRRSGSVYSTWWNGGLRTTPYFHNQVGLLTETIGSPTPAATGRSAKADRPASTGSGGGGRAPPRGGGPRPRPPPRPPPPRGGGGAPPRHGWRFRESIEYSVTANRAVLDIGSRHRERWLYNIYRMGRNSIERGSRDSWTASPHRPIGRVADPRVRDPRGYILPADQPDFLTATKFVNALLHAGVVVHRATTDFSVNARRYPAGSYIVKTAQAFRPHVLDMFEPQDHPDDFSDGGGAPRPPYDSAGWTLAFQMGVKFDRVLDGFDGPFERIIGAATPPRGAVANAHGAVGYLVSHHQNDAAIAINRLLDAGERVFWLRDRKAGTNADTGVIYIAAGRSTAAILETAARDLGLTFTGVHTPPARDALRLRRVRIGLVDRYGGWSSSGWIRWILERYEFPFEVVYPQRLDAGNLASRYDVVILPSEAGPTYGSGDITVATTVPSLKRFVNEGGTLLAIGRAASVGTFLDLPISDPVQRLPRHTYFVPGSVLRVASDNTTPLAYGFETEVDVFFDNSPVFRLEPGAEANGIRPVAWFASAAPLRSGWAWGQAHLEGTVAIVDAPLGKGRALLFGPEITFRAQPHGTFKFLFNGIYYGKATPSLLY